MIPASRIASTIRSESVAQSPQLRMAVVALPPPSRGVAARTETDLDGVTAFLDGLFELPLASWLAIGRALIADRQGLAVRQAAWSDVEDAIGTYNLAVAAWHVRDALETVVGLVSRPVPGWSRDERCQFAAAHGAGEAAALALRARAHVRHDIVRILCSPFAPFLDFSWSVSESERARDDAPSCGADPLLLTDRF